MSTIEKAKQFAVKAHKDQKYGEFPYSHHLEQVQRNLNIYATKIGDAEHTAAWLHDTLEDTDTTFEQLYSEFGRVVARLVFACTDEPGANRKERHERTYPKLKAAGRSAIAIKLADRISNVEHSLNYNHDMFKMYQKEYGEFKKALHIPGELKDMWAHLDVLMDRNIEPPKQRKVQEGVPNE